MIHRQTPCAAAVPVLVMLGLGIGCATQPPWEKTFLSEAVGQATTQEVRKELGKPQLRTTAPDGGSVWVYEFSRGRIDEGFYECWEYTLTFDARNVLRDKEEIDCAQQTGYDPASDEEQYLQELPEK